jgi:cytochrome c oxidase assembly protein subunit 15
MRRDRLPVFAWGVIAYNIAVILWGAFVRATGSGAGCGSHWPLCNGEVLPRAPQLATLIEFSHRVTSGIALLLVVALAVAVYLQRPRRHPARRAAFWSVLFMLGEAAVGAAIVLFEYVADNASIARALFMASHLLNTFLLLGALALTARALGEPRPAALPAVAGGGERARIALAVAALLLVGASGAVSALGDTLFPAQTLEQALQDDLSPTAHLLIRLRVLHPLLAVGTAIYLLLLCRPPAAGRSPPRSGAGASGAARGPANAITLLVLAQLVAGTANVALLAPVWMQLVHLLIADALWISFVIWAAERLAAASVKASGAARPLATQPVDPVS